MNILEKRKVNSYINDIVKNLTFKNNKLKLAGSASLASQRYYADYDFNCNIKTRKQTVIYNEFKRILSYTNDKLYFLEFKIEYLDGTKLKLNNNYIKLSMFKNIKFIRLITLYFLISFLKTFQSYITFIILKKIRRLKLKD